MHLLLCMMYHLLQSLNLVQCVLMCMSKNPSCMVNHSVNATSDTSVCIDSCYLKTNVQISSKTKCVHVQFKVDTGADTYLLPLDLYHKLHPNATAKSLQKDSSVHLFAYIQSEIQLFGTCPL